MNVENILSRLEGVKQIGYGKWKARCCAHQDRTPSLYITEAEDRLLLHCFGGCEVNDILAAIGLTIEALFPERNQHTVGHGRPMQTNRFPYADVMRGLSHEALVVAMGATAAASGSLTEADRERIVAAAERIKSALTAAGVA